MNEQALWDLAWRVNSLLADRRARDHFRTRCRQYLALWAHPGLEVRSRGEAGAHVQGEKREADTPRPPPLPFGTDGDLDPKPPLLACERYAILAALHEVVCHQEQPVSPAPQYNDRIMEETIQNTRRNPFLATGSRGAPWCGTRGASTRAVVVTSRHASSSWNATSPPSPCYRNDSVRSLTYSEAACSH